MKSCGSCDHFIKFKNDHLSSGLCSFFDARTDTDRGRKCEKWKGIKYKRKGGQTNDKQ